MAEATDAADDAADDVASRGGGPRRAGPWAVAREIIDFVMKSALLLGLGIGALEYFESERRMRVERSLGYVERFETDAVGEAVVEIARVFREYERQFVIARRRFAADPSAGEAIHVQLARMLAYDVRDGAGLRDELDRVIGFFDSLELCIEERLCDEPAARAFFGAYAATLFANFEPYICDRRVAVPRYAGGLERFVAAGAGAAATARGVCE